VKCTISPVLQYRLGGEEDTGYFSIDKLSGLITAKSRLDRERQGTYTFSVLAVGEYLRLG